MLNRKLFKAQMPAHGLRSALAAGFALALSAACLPVAAFAQTGAAPAGGATTADPGSAADSAVDPAAKAALERMGAYLRSLQVLQVEVTSTREEVFDNGLKSQSEWVTNLVARKPDRLFAHTTSDAQDRQFFYDGKQFTLWAERTELFATVPAPPTIAELVRALEENFGIEIPLVDLFRWGTAEDASASITAAMDLGPGSVGGTTCHHYAFRQEALDWQIWIQEGDYPLPRKLVLTTTTDEARPQFVATYTWNLAPSFNDAAFTFDPPASAHRIEIATLSPAAGEQK